MSYEKDAVHIGVWGTTGNGKGSIIREVLKERRRVVVFDFAREFTNATVIVQTELELLRALRANWAGSFLIAYWPDDERDPVPQCEMVARVVKRAQGPYNAGADGRKLTFYVEEAAEVIRNVQGQYSVMTGLPNWGRHFGVELIASSQRLAQISTTFRNACRINYFFGMEEEIDRERIARTIGKQYRAELDGLERFHYLRYENRQISRGVTQKYS